MVPRWSSIRVINECQFVDLVFPLECFKDFLAFILNQRGLLSTLSCLHCIFVHKVDRVTWQNHDSFVSTDTSMLDTCYFGFRRWALGHYKIIVVVFNANSTSTFEWGRLNYAYCFFLRVVACNIVRNRLFRRPRFEFESLPLWWLKVLVHGVK